MTEQSSFLAWASGLTYNLSFAYAIPLVPKKELEWGICANVFETDRVFRSGAKVWIAGGTGGEGWYKFQWNGLSRSGRRITKWAPTMRFHNFRAAWIPPPIRKEIDWMLFADKPSAAAVARKINVFAEEERTLHPNRKPSRQYPKDRE